MSVVMLTDYINRRFVLHQQSAAVGVKQLQVGNVLSDRPQATGCSVNARIAGLIHPTQALTREELTWFGKLDLHCFLSRSHRRL